MPSITIKNDEFRYPTRDELRKIKPDTPRLKTFGFPYFDVALGKLVDNATIAFVYEAITDHKLKLLS